MKISALQDCEILRFLIHRIINDKFSKLESFDVRDHRVTHLKIQMLLSGKSVSAKRYLQFSKHMGLLSHMPGLKSTSSLKKLGGLF